MKEIQNQIDQWIKTYGVRYFDEKTNMLLLMEEMGELSRLMARKYGEQSFKNSEQNAAVDEMIAEELSDVLFVLICLANQMGIDLNKAMAKNLDKKTTRDHHRHLENKKLKD